MTTLGNNEPKSEVSDELIVVTSAGYGIWTIHRGLEYAIVPGCHNAPISGLADTADSLSSLTVTGSRPGTATRTGNTGEFERIFSCALDGTVRVWDPYDM